jgi:predicted ATPase
MTDWLDLREETFRLLRARAFPDDASQPFALVRRMWFDRFQIAEDTPLEIAEARWVEHFKEIYGLIDYEEPAHALGLLIGLPFEDSPYIKGMRNDPTQVKGRALVVSRDLMDKILMQYPVVILLEDLQWTDPSSWEYLTEVFLGEQNEGLPNGLFILAAARLEWHPPEELKNLLESSLSGENNLTKWGTLIHLSPLTDQSIKELVIEIFQRAEGIPDSIIDLLVDRSDGTPYYTEEMVNWFIDHEILDTQGEHWHFRPERLRAQPLPATLQHLLLTRLSSLSTLERDALQRGSIFGRRFWTSGVEALSVTSGADVLAHLQPRGFVEAHTDSTFQGDTEWNFHQNLFQEVTYESVLKRERVALHRLAAEWLESQARQAGRLDEFAGLLGNHLELAGELSMAADWYQRAGKCAMGQGAPREAAGFYSRALELLPPVDKQRRWQVLLGRESALTILGDAEPRQADLEALLGLAHSIENDLYLAEVYFRQAEFYRHIGDDHLSWQTSLKALNTARKCGAEAIVAKALALHAQASGSNEKATIVQNIEEALKLARKLGDDNVLADVLYRAAYCIGDIDIAGCFALCNELIELAHRLGNHSWEAAGLGNMGVVYIGEGCLNGHGCFWNRRGLFLGH